MAMTAKNLTGIWDGMFSHPRHGPVMFMATLIESGSSLSGSITEPCMVATCQISTHHATLTGNRNGSAVSFVKQYDPPGFGYNTVRYEGAVNGDATEIDGRWTLPRSQLSGQFLMVRSGRSKQAAKTKKQAAEPVR
jgi:hypothetical protein